MKVTKYPQSCLIIEIKNKRIIIDPGSFVASNYTVQDLLPVDLILITHEHFDHMDLDLMKSLLSDKKVPVLANPSSARMLKNFQVEVIKDFEEFFLDDVKIQARELQHSLMPNGEQGPQNTGYVIDDIFFHPGDGIKINNLRINTLATPLSGPDISPKDVVDFVKSVSPRHVIPMHYDYWPANPEMFTKLFGTDVDVRILQNQQQTIIEDDNAK